MSLIELANNDIKDITTDVNGWAVAMTLVAPDMTTLVCTGLHSKHHSGYDSDGLQVNTKNAHISVSEDVLIDGSYPYRNAAGEVDLKDHLVTVKDSTRVDVQYIIREWFQDETIGLIVCVLGDYGLAVNPVPLTPTALTATLSTDLYGEHTVSLAWVDTTGGVFDTYEIWRSVDGAAYTLLASTANPTSYDDVFSDVAPKFYRYKILAVKDAVNSLFSNEDGALTLELSGDVFALTANLYGLNVVDLAWTDSTVGNYDIYEIWRSENGADFALLATTTNADNYRDSSNLYENEVKYYDYKIKAVTGTLKSEFSNSSGVITLKIEDEVLSADISDLTNISLDGTDLLNVTDKSDSGADLTQLIEANRGAVDSALTPSKATLLAANSEYLECINTSLLSPLKKGSIIQILNNDDVNNAAHFSFTNSSTDPNHFRVGVGATNKAILNISSSSGFTQLVCDTVLTRISVVEWKTNGSSYSVFVNGIESTFTVNIGINNGNWWGDITGLDTIRIASYHRLSTTTYEDTVFRELRVISKPLPSSLSLAVYQQLQVKHNL